MPVGVELGWVERSEKTNPPLIIWNQRWEYDKDPVRLFGALGRLAETGADFRLALCGENFRNVPEEFGEARRSLGERIVHYGHANLDVYQSLLLDSAVVISTAKHEFFGIGAVEAMAAGAIPVFPKGLSYPGLIPEQLHSETLYTSDDDLDRLLSDALSDDERRARLRSNIAPAMCRFSWSTLAPEYDKSLE